MNDLLNLLESLNRKERFFLVGDALDNESFTLGINFRSRLEKAAGMSVPSDAWVAMDYHLDWIAAAVHVTSNGIDISSKWDNLGQEIVRGNQEDIDLIVGFLTGTNTTLIMIEAKGDTPWSNSQMSSKVERLGKIFGTDKLVDPTVIPILVLVSPKRPTKNLKSDDWSRWMTDSGSVRWMPMKMSGRRQLIRCDENGKSFENGNHAILVAKD